MRIQHSKYVTQATHRGLPIQCQQAIALLVLILVSPLCAVVALSIKLHSQGPILFCQTRVGQYGKPFKLYKFRSMYDSEDHRYHAVDELISDRQGICQKFRQDPRITPIGRFIRKFSIDELPQLFNVLRGEMVLVGPRPALPKEVAQYQPSMHRRLLSRPGLTGLWQVSGRADTSFNQQIRLDIRYVRQQSAWLDLKILLLTVPTVLLAKGAY